MPATAGRVRMPANNRVHSSAALQTHGIWQSAIGYDPYAPNKEDNKKSAQPQSSNPAEPEGENAYASFQGLLALARITGSNADETRGCCKRCGRVGHLTFQCRNFLSTKDDKDSDAIQAAVISGLEKLKGKGTNRTGEGESLEESSEEESESSDSDYDSEIEKAIASRKFGEVGSSKDKSFRKKKDGCGDDDDGSDSGKRKKRGLLKKRKTLKRANSDSEGDRKRRKEKRKRKDESSDEDCESRRRREKSRKDKRRRRRRSHRDSDDSDKEEDLPSRHKRKSRRAASPSDTRVGRESRDKKKLGKSRKHS